MSDPAPSPPRPSPRGEGEAISADAGSGRPDPRLPAGKIVLVMDGACALCSRGARIIAANDHADRFRIATVQSALGRALLTENGLDPDDPDSWLLIKGGEALTGARAVIAAGLRLKFPWTVLASLGAAIPGPFREPAYRLVAKNRIAWFGRGDLCGLPDLELKRRLIA